MPTPADLIDSYMEVWHRAIQTSAAPIIRYEGGWFRFYYGSGRVSYRRTDLVKMQANIEARIAATLTAGTLA